MKNKQSNKPSWDISEKDKQKEMRKWMQDPEIIYFSSDEQRKVVLNPGHKQEVFNKVYPVRGRIILYKTHYIEDLPKNCLGRIIAVTAIQPKDKKGNPKGLLKAKPLGKFWELFEPEGPGIRLWVHPSEYRNVHDRKTRRKTKKLQKPFKSISARIEDDEANKQVLRGFKGRDFKENSNASRIKSKSRSSRKRSKRLTGNTE